MNEPGERMPLLTEMELRDKLYEALMDFKKTAAWNRVRVCKVDDISLGDLATDVAPLLWERL